MDIYPESILTHEGMGTGMAQRASGPRAADAVCAAREEVRRLERLLSRFWLGSNMERLNRSGGEWVDISLDTLRVLEAAQAFDDLSGGLFRITVGPMADIRGQAGLDLLPCETEFARLLPLVAAGGQDLDPPACRAQLKCKGQALDLGGIAKGYTADRLIAIFLQYGCKAACTNLGGGDVAVLGKRPGGGPWRVGIRHPRREGCLMGAVMTENCAVVTSGDCERFRDGADGRRRHHLIDPRTGQPADSGVISKFDGVDAVFVDTNGSAFLSAGMAGRFMPEEGIRANRLV